MEYTLYILLNQYHNMKMLFHYYYISICSKLMGDLLPIFKPFEVLIVPVTTKLLVYALGEFNRIWSDDRAIVVVLVPPDGAKRSYPCSNERYDLPEPKPTCKSILEQ